MSCLTFLLCIILAPFAILALLFMFSVIGIVALVFLAIVLSFFDRKKSKRKQPPR